MLAEPGRILAVDPGEKRHGLAISDPTQTISTALMVLNSQSPKQDAGIILDVARENDAVMIVVGQPLHWDGTESKQAESSQQLAELLGEMGSLPVEMADEYGSTQAARKARLKMNVSRKKRSGHLDDLAAAILLQNYLDNRNIGAQG